jgi:hypothetical protein
VGEERRKFKRINAPVFCRPVGKPLFGRRRALDVSLGGMRLYADEAPAIGDRLGLELFLPNGQGVTCKVEVVWIDELPIGEPAKFDIGVRFVEIDAFVLEQLSAVLKDG